MAFDAGEIKGKLTIDKTQWDKSAKQIKTSQQKMAVQTKKTGSAFKGMWKQVAVGIGVTGLITSGIRGLLRQMGDTIKVGRSFEKEWANVTTMLSVSRAETEKMKDELRMLSPTLGDTTELAKGMYQVLSASIEPAKAIRFLGEAAKSAKAGVTDTKTAVDGLTTVINAYGMEAEAVTEVSDIMFGIVKRGKLTYDELASSLGTVVPVASTVGVEFKEVGAAIATLTRQGINASKATMQLRQIFMAILKPSEEAKQVAEDLEIQLGSMALETQGLSGWLADLKEKTKGNADIITKIIPNVRALTAGLALVGKASKGYAEDQEFLNEVMGFTNEAFRKQMESVDFWVETFEVAADKIKIALYEGLTSQLRESIRTTEDFDKVVTEKTNSAATAVSLHVSVMVETLGKLGKAWKDVDGFLFGWIDRARGAKEGSDDLAEAQIKLDEALARAGIKKIIEDIKEQTEVTEELAEITLTAAEKTAMLARQSERFALIRFDSQIEQMKQLMDEMIGIEEAPDLIAYEWEKSMSGMEDNTLNFMASIIPGMEFMTKSITEDTKEMAKQNNLTFTDMAAVAGNVLTAIAGQSKALAIAGAVISTYAAAAKTLQTFGWPAAIPFMAAAIIAGFKQVKAIKAQDIPSAQEGGVTQEEGIYRLHPRELILPIEKAPALLNEIRSETIGGAKVDFNFYAPIISTTGLSERDVDEVAEYLLEKLKTEVGRYGRKL